jgi:peptidyl-prolyl isomerase E (cyclophilin E)
MTSHIRSGRHRGFGFIEFEAADDAMAAVDNMHNSEILGKVCREDIKEI